MDPLIIPIRDRRVKAAERLDLFGHGGGAGGGHRPRAAPALALAFLHLVIQRRRHEKWSLRMDDEGISARAGRFRRVQARWSELRSVDATRDEVRLVTADGREQRLAENRDELTAAVTAAARLRLPRGSE